MQLCPLHREILFFIRFIAAVLGLYHGSSASAALFCDLYEGAYLLEAYLSVAGI